MGSVTLEFEEKIKEYLGVKHVIATNTGTSAIHLALDGYGIGKLSIFLLNPAVGTNINEYFSFKFSSYKFFFGYKGNSKRYPVTGSDETIK